ncbi:MAG: ROK family transcriptional regulator [Anaerolineae bacterium]|nr:ROK family transcriptional regulator [Anaerolineae bacterium]
MSTWQNLSGSSTATVKTQNLTAILFALLQNERPSRVQMAHLTGLSATTITNLVAGLIEQGVVVESGAVETESRHRVGRPPTALQLVPEARYAIGVHIGVGRIHAAVANLYAAPVHSISWNHPLDQPADAVLDEVAQLVERVIEQSGVARERIVGVGVGASGLVDPHTGVNVFAPNLGWHDVPIERLLRHSTHLPVTVDNNVRAMTLSEAFFGAGRDVRTMALVYARIGVGAGFVVDGQVYRGSGAGAGEIGHMTIIPEGGAACRCGNTGCLETLISEPVVVDIAHHLAEQEPNGTLAACMREAGGTPIECIFAAARQGDATVQTLLESRARYLGIALANLVNVFNPELILLGGFLSQGLDLLLPAVESTMRQRTFANLGDLVQIKPASFGPQAGIIGAATLALNTFFYQQPELG